MKPIVEIKQLFDENGGLLRTRELYAGKVFMMMYSSLLRMASLKK